MQMASAQHFWGSTLRFSARGLKARRANFPNTPYFVHYD
jgi:hypothetical protein